MRRTRIRMFRASLMLLTLACLLTTSAVCDSTPPSWLQALGFGGSGDDIGHAVAVGADGSQYFAGEFNSSVQFDNTQLVSFGGKDAFLAKRDSTGAVIWAVQAGGSSDDWAQALALDASDNIYLTGEFYDSATFGSTDGKTLLTNGNGYSIFLAKYAPSGVLVWVQTGVIPHKGNYNWGAGVAVEPITGTVYVAGMSQANTTFSSADGTSHVVQGNPYWHMVLAKYDSNGNFDWGEANGANPNSMGTAIAVDAQANAYVVGWFENRTTFSSHDGNNISVTGFSPGQSDSNYPSDGFLVKYDIQGNAKWVNHFGGYVAHANAVAVSPAGNVSIVGDIGNIDFGSAGEETTTVSSRPPGKSRSLPVGHYTNPYNHDVIIATWDAAGVLKAGRRIGGTEDDIATGVAYDAAGRLWLSGTFTKIGNNQPHLLVLEFSGAALLGSARVSNASASSGGNTLSVDAQGRVFLTGFYQGTAVFGNTTLNSNGGFDIFLAELGDN